MPKKKKAVPANPSGQEIEEVASQIREVDFWRSVTFADMIKRYCEITMKKDNISPLHAIAMFHLVCSRGDSTPTQLAERMFRSKHSVTKIVDNLENEGLIVRDFSSQDRRVTHVKLTSAGLEYARINQTKGNRRGQQVMECLTAAERKTLVDLTRKLCSQMTDILEKI